MRLSIKKLLPFLFAILIPATAFADNQPIRNENQATLRDLGSELTVGSNYAVDRRGNIFTRVTDPSSGLTQSVIPVSNADMNGMGVIPAGYALVTLDAVEAASTSTVLNLTAHVAAKGDIIRFPSVSQSASLFRTWSTVCSVTTNTVTLCSTLPFTPQAAQDVAIMRSTPLGAIGSSSTGETALDVRINPTLNTGATSLMKLEDTAHSSGDAGVQVFGITNESGNQISTTADNDYIPYGMTRVGDVFSVPRYSVSLSDTIQLGTREDSPFSNASALLKMAGQAVSAISQTVDTSGDAAPPSMDLGNRLVTTNAPAGETWWACTGEITTATNTQIKASVASNRHYITAFSCAATSTSPNQIYLTDGSGGTAMDFVNTTSNAVAPGPQNTYPTPLRGSSATGVFVTTITTGGVRCCASGYISTI